MYMFKYIPGEIYRNDSLYKNFLDFKSEYPEFPLIEGVYFEYRTDGFDLINSEGHHFPQDNLDNFQNLIIAINNLGE